MNIGMLFKKKKDLDYKFSPSVNNFRLSLASHPTFLGYFSLASLTNSSALSRDTSRSWEKDGDRKGEHDGNETRYKLKGRWRDKVDNKR